MHLLHLRLLTRVHVVAVFAIFSLLYLAWIYPTLRVKTRISHALSGQSRRIVVFGDSFSVTGASLKSEGASENSLVGGQKWTEILCDEWLCDSLDDYAKSYPLPGKTYSGGAVLDNEAYINTTSHNDSSVISLLPDMRAQVQEWIEYEKQRADTAPNEPNEVLFSITFGFWDIAQYATLDIKEAQDAISCSLYELFQQLDVIAEHSTAPPRIVLPKLWDVTFHPRFAALSYGEDAKHYGEQQHKTVFLVRYWNTALVQMAGQWSRGDIFLLDWDNWLVEQIRSSQMHDRKIKGAPSPDFLDVSSPCIELSASDQVINAGEDVAVGDVSVCSDSSNHLWWDDTHFGPMAHQLLGQEAARIVAANESANAQIRREVAATNGKTNNQLVRVHLVPSLAPGN